MAARVSDWYFMNGNTPEGHKAQIDEIKPAAAANGRKIRFGANAFIIARETERKAHDVLREIIDKADVEAVHGFGEAVKQAGKSTSDKQGMWANSNFEDLVQYNDGFRTGLIGTPEQIAERIVALKGIGVNLVLGGFLHFQEEVEFRGPRAHARTPAPDVGASQAGGRAPPAARRGPGATVPRAGRDRRRSYAAAATSVISA